MIFILGLMALAMPVHADENEGAYLDPPYADLVHPVDEVSPDFFSLLPSPMLTNAPAPPRSDTEANIGYQTAVKSQASRGTCSFFSTIGVLESGLIRFKNLAHDLNLSEQWLAYVVERNKTEDGSVSNFNFNQLAYYGAVEQTLMPYEGGEWKTANDNPTAQARCGGVPAGFVRGCLVSHYDPRLLTESDDALKSSNLEFWAIRNRARQFRQDYLASSLDWHPARYEVRTTGEIKSLLAQGIPLTLDVNFFFGAWNHRLADDYGIKRDLDHWNRGIIGYPERGSMDRLASPKHKAGHSVVVVGYDDDAVVQTQVLMADGSWKVFSYRGVYYIKNSWGTNGFGSQFALDGVAHPGYGMITQKYANEQGSFYRLPIH